MPVHPLILRGIKEIKHQLHRIYMLIPFFSYVALVFLYPTIQKSVLKKTNIGQCSHKTFLIMVDEYLFGWLYQFIRDHQSTVALALFAVPYIIHFGVPAVYIFWLLVKQRGWRLFWLFVITIGMSSCISIIMQYNIPVPPPWKFEPGMLPQARFAKVDEILPIKIFSNTYNHNPLICGAFPSVHVQWAATMAMNGGAHILFGIFYTLWTASAAIYSSHHWVSDILGGLLIATFSNFVCRWYISKFTFESLEDHKEMIRLTGTAAVMELQEQV